MATVREQRKNGVTTSGGMTVRKQRTVDENKQYADAMKSSRLQEIKKETESKKAVADKRAKDSAFARLNAKGAEDYAAEKVDEYQTAYNKLPKIRRVIADVVNSPIGKSIIKGNEITSDFIRRGLDTASIGVTDAADKALIKSPLLDPKSKEVIQTNRDRSQKSVAGTVGSYAGYLGPGVAADRAVVTVAGAALKKLPKVVNGLIRGTAAGTLDTAAQEAGDVAFRDKKFDPLNVAIGGTAGGALGAAGPLIGKAYRSFMGRVKTVTPKVEQRITETLALPEPKARGNVNPVQTPDVVYGTGKVYKPEPLALPRGNVVPPVRLKPASNNAVLDNVMQRIKPVVTERMTPPLENPNELAKWVQLHLGADISLNEVRKLPYEDLRQMAEMMRGRLNMADEAHKVASEMGHNLSDLLDGKLPSLGQKVAKNAQERVYGIYPDGLPNVRTPQFNREVLSGAAAPVQRVGRSPNAPVQPFKSELQPQPINNRVELTNPSRPVPRQLPEVSPAQVVTPTPHTPKARDVWQQIENEVFAKNQPPVWDEAELTKWLEPHIGKNSLNQMNMPEKLREATNVAIRLGREEAPLKRQLAKDRGYDYDELARKAKQEQSEIDLRRSLEAEQLGNPSDSAPASIDEPMTVKARRDAEQVQQAPVTVRAKREAQTTETPSSLASSKEAQQSTNPIEQEAEQILQSVQHPRVRDRVYSYLDEAEKAARERLSKNSNRLSSTPVDVWTDYAIVGAAKLGKGTVKLADFTEEMVKDFGEHIRPHAQRIYGMAKEQLRQQERRASKEGQDALTFNESGVGDASTFEQKISRKAPKKKGSFSKWWENTRTQLVDDNAALEGFEKRVRGGKLASAEDSLYKAARMFKGVPEKAAQIVTQKLAPIVNSIEKAGYSADDLGRYALAKHAKDVNAAGYKSGYTNAEIQSVLIKYDSPEMDAAQKALVQVNRDMLKQLVDNGVVSHELAGVLNERWKNYIPLFRQLDDEAVGFETGLSKALANVANPIKSLKGSEDAVIDPLENMVKNIFRSTNAAERNKVASQLPKLAQIDTEANFIRKLGPLEEVGRKNVVNVKVNGENVKYEVEPEVYKALLNLDQESSNMLINVLSKPASLLRAGATLTPEFSLRNPMRDINQAFTVSKSGFNPLVDFPVGVVQAIAGKFGKGKLYQEWVENLGAYGNVMSMDRNVHRQALQKVLGEPASKKFVNIVTGKSLINLLRAISDTTESATKIGEYRAALRRGASPQEAGYRSRDIMDFGRAGTGIRPANKVIAFLNANIQGNSKLVRAFKENPVGTSTRAFASVTLPTVGVFMMQKYLSNEKQKETIDNAPEWQKQAFWLIPVPGSDYVARLPKPFGLNLVFANPVEHALNFFYNKDKEAFDGFAGETLQGLTIPTQISGLLPIYEGMSNYSFFRQGEIIPMREQNLTHGDQYDPVRTTETAKLLAKGADKLTGGKGAFKNFSSPRVMDHTIQGLTAGLGKYATDAVDSILMGKVPFTSLKVSKPLVSRPEAPAQNLEQKPLLRSFLVDPNQGGKVMDKFYSEIDKMNKEKASNKFNDRTFGGTKKKPLYLEKAKEGTLKSFNKSSDSVSDINKEIRSIEKSMTLTPQQKRQQIDTLMAQRMKIINDSVLLLKNSQ